jgi:hypothetical protein
MMPHHALGAVNGLTSLGSQFARIRGKVAEVFDGPARVENAVAMEEDAVCAAKEVARLFGERKRRTDFGDDLADSGEVYGFGIKQFLN